MKNAGKTILTLFVGMLFGAALFGGGVAHAAEIFYKAVPSTNIIYLVSGGPAGGTGGVCH